MFPSTNSVNPFPQLSSPYNPSSYITDHPTNDIFLYHHHNPLTIPLLPANPPLSETELNMVASSNAMMSKQQDILALSGDHHHHHHPTHQYNHPSSVLPIKRPVKKDRHSKIYTAQGLRDRRVRLSIEIARKFFDLQDMLGFDKASKTLDWLLTKSKRAIKELAQTGCAKSLSSTSNSCEVVSENCDLDGIVSKNGSSAGDKKMKKLQNSAVNLLAKESRAKARARARERTRVKMCTQRLHESKKCPDPSPHILNLSRSLTQHQAGEKSGSYTHNNMPSSFKFVAHEAEGASSQSLSNQLPKGNVIEESIVIKRKLKPSTTMGYQQNLVTLKEASCNNNTTSNSNNYLPHLGQNWDINNAIARSSLCAITNMNLSTGKVIKETKIPLQINF